MVSRSRLPDRRAAHGPGQPRAGHRPATARRRAAAGSSSSTPARSASRRSSAAGDAFLRAAAGEAGAGAPLPAARVGRGCVGLGDLFAVILRERSDRRTPRGTTHDRHAWRSFGLRPADDSKGGRSRIARCARRPLACPSPSPSACSPAEAAPPLPCRPPRPAGAARGGHAARPLSAGRRAGCPGAPAAHLERPPAVRSPCRPPPRPSSTRPTATDADKKLDAGRHPGELLAFLGLKPGDARGRAGRRRRLHDGAARARRRPEGQGLGPEQRLDDASSPRSAGSSGSRKPVMKNVVRVDRELDAPLPPDAKNLDAVVIVLFYHDTVWMGVDRDKMNKAVFDALKHGGRVRRRRPQRAGGPGHRRREDDPPHRGALRHARGRACRLPPRRERRLPP